MRTASNAVTALLAQVRYQGTNTVFMASLNAEAIYTGSSVLGLAEKLDWSEVEASVVNSGAERVVIAQIIPAEMTGEFYPDMSDLEVMVELKLALAEAGVELIDWFFGCDGYLFSVAADCDEGVF